MDKILSKLWLSKEESQIYLYLLKNQDKTLTEISKQTIINRPKLYKIIPLMLENWLISKVIKWKRIFYKAENPNILKNYLENIKRDFETFVPEIQKLYEDSFSKPVFKHFSWKHWIKNIFIDIWNTLWVWEVFYRYSSRKDIWKTSISQKDYEMYKILREEKKLERYVITNEYLNTLKPKKLEKEVVIIPKNYDLFEDNITKIIYSNKVAIIDYNTNESFIIESQIFANFEKKIFMLLFKFLR